MLPRGATAGEKALIRTFTFQPDGTSKAVPLPLKAIESLGATLVEEYETQAVIDLGKASIEEIAKATALPVEPLPDHDKIMLHGYTLDASGGLPVGVTAPVLPASTPGLYLVVLRSLTKPEWVKSLEAVAVKIVSYLPSNTVLVYAPLATLESLRTAPGPVINVLPFAPPFKLLDDGRLLGADGFSRVLVEIVDDPTSEVVIESIEKLAGVGTFGRLESGSMVAAWGELPNDVVESLAYQPQVVSLQPMPELRPSGERESLIVAGQLVSATEGGRTVYKPTCATNCGVPPTQSCDYYAWLGRQGIGDTSAIYLGVMDTGLDTGYATPNNDVHIDFKNGLLATRVMRQYNPAGAPDTSDCYAHGTLVAAVMAGSGGKSWATQFGENCGPCSDSCVTCSATDGCFWAGAGVAPLAHIASAKIYANQVAGWPNAVATALASFATDGIWAANLSSNEDGTSYSALSRQLDIRARDANGSGVPMRIIVAAGNYDNDSGGRVVAPGTAKNVITVGASETYNRYNESAQTCRTPGERIQPPRNEHDNAYDVPTFSASGAGDGRQKPDLVAPGTRAMGALTRSQPADPNPGCWGHKGCGRNLPNDETTDGTVLGMGGNNPETWDNGTSFAAPAVTGAAGLVSNWYLNRHPGALPSPALTKAMLINAALDIAGGRRGGDTIGSIPSPIQGWGKVDLTRAFPATNTFYELDQTHIFTSTGGGWWLRQFSVSSTSQKVQITLTWTDREAAENAPAPLINDLDLLVTTSWPNEYHGNQISGGVSIQLTNGSTAWDRDDNVERVLFMPGVATFWVYVIPHAINAKAVPNGPGTVNQDFALFVENAH